MSEPECSLALPLRPDELPLPSHDASLWGSIWFSGIEESLKGPRSSLTWWKQSCWIAFRLAFCFSDSTRGANFATTSLTAKYSVTISKTWVRGMLAQVISNHSDTHPTITVHWRQIVVDFSGRRTPGVAVVLHYFSTFCERLLSFKNTRSTYSGIVVTSLIMSWVTLSLYQALHKTFIAIPMSVRWSASCAFYYLLFTTLEIDLWRQNPLSEHPQISFSRSGFSD